MQQNAVTFLKLKQTKLTDTKTTASPARETICIDLDDE